MSDSQNEKKALTLANAAIKQISKLPRKTIKRNLEKAWKTSKGSKKVLTIVVFYLSEIGELEAAMTLLQAALPIHGETPDVLHLIGKIALQMQDYRIAEKVYTRAVQLDPKNPEPYQHLLTALKEQGRTAEAFEMTKELLSVFPDTASLWNMLGILTQIELRDDMTARAFFKQAMQYDIGNATYIYNFSSAVRRNPESEEFYLQHALKYAPENSQIHLTYGLFLLSKGRLEEAWPHYWYRRDHNLGSRIACAFSHSYRMWEGQDLTEKSIIVCAEQGLGDEIFFLMALSRACRNAEHVYVACDPRLVSILNRSFQNVKAFPYEDTVRHGVRYRNFPFLEKPATKARVNIDYFALFGDLMQFTCPSAENLMSLHGGYLLADPARAQKNEHKIKDNRARLKIGFSWTSGNIKNERKHFYQDMAFYVTLARRLNADFYCLQYQASNEELETLEAIDNITVFRSVDLKQDIEENLAIIANLDLVMGPPVATQCLALALGVPVWLFNQGAPWYFLGKEEMPDFFDSKSKWWCLDNYKKAPEDLIEAVINNLNAW